MSSGKYDKITNYNLSFELLKEAVAEFDGYVLGLSQNDIWLFLDNFEKQEQIQTQTDKDINTFLYELAPRLLDRTTGTYFLNDILSNENAIRNSNLSKNKLLIKQLMTVVPPSKLADQFQDNNFVQGTRTIGETKAKHPDGREIVVKPSGIINMLDALPYYNSAGVVKDIVRDKDGNALKDSDGNERMFISGLSTKDVVPAYPGINQIQTPNRNISPSLGSFVMQHPKASIAARGKEHLPIFFNAIPPIEMSRCVPYIDLRVVTTNYRQDKDGNKVGASRLNNVSFMRFLAGEDKRRFELDDAIGFGDLKPVRKSVRDDERKASEFSDVAYMDIFTSPQTMANANINSNKGHGFAKSLKSNDNPILEPISPFLTLNSLTVQVTGTGYGLLSSKKASMKLTLHDRSRMKDLSPLLSSAQFASTKIILEFGWNHPEGGPNSDNVIGKYLNALKDRSVYQVTKVDYGFSDGSTVDITIGLAAYGFRQTERIHAGAGPEVPINFLSDIIDKAVEEKLERSKNFESAPEIRKKLKLNQRAARSDTSTITWGAYKEIQKLIANQDNYKSIISVLKAVMEIQNIKANYGSIGDDKEALAIRDEILKPLRLNSGIPPEATAELEAIFGEKTKENVVKRLYGKLEAIKDTKKFCDPFISSLVYGCAQLKPMSEGGIGPGVEFNNLTVPEQYEKIYEISGMQPPDEQGSVGQLVTLGKLICNYIGLPLASSCLYDEVQVVFYPLNHQAAGGRRHTTASFPIQIHKFEEVMKKSIKQSSNLTVKRMFSLLSKLVSDKNSPAYQVADIYTELDKLNESSAEDQAKAVLDYINKNGGGDLGMSDLDAEIAKQIQEMAKLDAAAQDSAINLLKSGPTATAETLAQEQGISEEEAKNLLEAQEKDNAELKKGLTKLLSARRTQLNKQTSAALPRRLRSLYEKDGMSNIFPGMDRFVRPSISMDYEVVDVIDTKTTNDKHADSFFKKWYKSLTPSNASSDGLLANKTILRIHIYDEEAVQSPSEHTLLTAMTEGVNNRIVEGEDGKIKTILASDSLTYNQAKQFIKRSYPTIIYGAAGSTVKSLGVDANTSGGLSNVVMIESYGNLKKGSVEGHNYENNFESIVMFPQTVNASMLGMPMIGIGNTIFIDFGTDTSLDNIYTVTNVSHNISSGDFSTSLTLVPSNLGAVDNFNDSLIMTLEKLPDE